MNLPKFELFIKLMKMTTSSNDGEALVALRKANGILHDSNVDWESLLRSKVTVQNASQVQSQGTQTGRTTTNPKYANTPPKQSQSQRFTNKVEIELMLDALLSHTAKTSNFYGFLTSIRDWWVANGFLTEPQYNAIKKAYEKI